MSVFINKVISLFCSVEALKRALKYESSNIRGSKKSVYWTLVIKIERKIKLLKNKTKNISQDFLMSLSKEISKQNLVLVENSILLIS